MRKSGFFPRLALVNLMRNGRFYGPYLLSCGMTAAMYYILSYLTFSDIVASVRGAGYLQSLMYLGRLVVTLFSAVLLLYANSFVMKRRRRELGLYNILGLEKRHTARLMVWETLYCAAAAIVGGCCCSYCSCPTCRWSMALRSASPAWPIPPLSSASSSC